MLGVFESNDTGPLALHANRVNDDAHRNPDAARAVTPLAIGPARTDLFDVHVLLVHADDGEPEAHPLVVPGRDAGERRLAGADHVPPRSDEVHDVAQRRHADRSMWVVRKQRFTGRGAGGAHDPVVRPLEPPVAHVSIGLSQGAEVDACQIEPSGGIERPRRIRRPEGLRAFHAHEVDQARALQFIQRVPRHREGRHPLERHLVAPGLGRGPEQRELDGRVGPDVGDPGVDAVDECAHDLASVRRVARPFARHVPAVGEETRDAVTLDRAGSDDLGEPPLPNPPPHFHLPQPVLRGDEALGEEQVLLRLGVDVRHAPPVSAHLDHAIQAGDGDGPVQLCQAAAS